MTVFHGVPERGLDVKFILIHSQSYDVFLFFLLLNVRWPFVLFFVSSGSVFGSLAWRSFLAQPFFPIVES